MVNTHQNAAEWPVTWWIALSLALPSHVSCPCPSLLHGFPLFSSVQG